MTWTYRAEAILDGITETGLCAAAIVAAAWRAGVEPDATAGLTAASLALYAEPKDLLTGPLYPLTRDRELIAAAADAATDTGDHARATRILSDQVTDALSAAMAAADAAARWLAKAETSSERASARRELRRAEQEIADCEHALTILVDAGERLGRALDGLERVPDDLLEVYDLAYEHRRNGGTFPFDANNFITGVQA
jgi:hypothetical protein